MWEIDSKLKYKCNKESNREMTTLPLFKIRINKDQVPPDKDKKSSQFLEFATFEDQEDGVG